jgi:hypothetical protein
MKIFVSICSYRDPLLHYTLESLIEGKSNKHEATYSVLEQTVFEDSIENLYPELVARPDVFYKRIDPTFSDGVGWARKVNSLNVRDEDFFYQIDSHMLFDQNWDRYLVEDYKRGVKKSGSKKVIIDGATKTFTLEDEVPHKHIEANGVTTYAQYFLWGRDSINGVHGHHIPTTTDVVPTVHLFAGNLFTHVEWLTNVGINHLSFYDGEEQLLTLSSFEAGYYMYSPTEVHCYHFAGASDWPTKQWIQPIITMDEYGKRVALSVKQWTDYLKEVPESVLIEYYNYSGVDYIDEKIEDRKRAYPTLIKLQHFPFASNAGQELINDENEEQLWLPHIV